MAQQPANPSSSNPLVTVVIPVVPVPASRPRVTRWGTYYLKPYKNWREAARAALPIWHDFVAPVEVPLLADVLVVCKRPAKPANVYPIGDFDNYEKAAFDMLQSRGCIADDKQIVACHTLKRYAAKGEAPRTRIQLWRYDGEV